MMKLWNPEATKYLIRFGSVILIAAPIIYFLMGPTSIRTIAYKLLLVGIFFAMAELLWAIGYKWDFRKGERGDLEKLGIFIFRGVFYGAIIISGTLGL